MANGTIKRLVRERGFGFLTDDRGDDVFFHRTAMSHGTDFDRVTEGQKVTFEFEDSPKGPRAGNVRLV